MKWRAVAGSPHQHVLFLSLAVAVRDVLALFSPLHLGFSGVYDVTRGSAVLGGHLSCLCCDVFDCSIVFAFSPCSCPRVSILRRVIERHRSVRDR